MKLFMGLDIGSSMSKGVIINDNNELVSKYMVKTGYSFSKAAEVVKEHLLKKTDINLNDIQKVVSSGYGRKNVEFADFFKTEIICHAKGAYFYFPEQAKVVDIGGQDNKVITLDKNGNILNFKMNRKCAAGTGAFIEETAHRLGVDIEEIDELARKADKDISISSFCTVFAQTEIIKLIKEGVSLENIAKGIFQSVAQRIIEMDTFSDNIIITGGVIANFPIIKEIVSEKIDCKILVPPFPQYCGAFGAALIGKELR